MNNFYSYNPTKILFGRGMIGRIGAELTDVRRILLLYGRGSIHRHGVYDQVRQAIGEISLVEFGGIEPNPEYEICLEAIDVARREQVDFILAVGGGSVIDAAKFIALATHFDGDEPWRIITGEAAAPARVLPVGCIQTVPATGSEGNNAFVLSRRALHSKLSYCALSLYPRFSVLDPETTLTIPAERTAMGLADMFVHALEQYATYPAAAPLQERQAEAILATVAEIAEPLLGRPDDYDLRAAAMWCGAQAVNGLISRGVPVDWATHAIGHELTALYDLPHAQTLSIVLGGVYRHQLAAKMARLAQYGRRIWGLSGPDEAVAPAAIEQTESFFERLGLPIRFSAIGLDGEAVAERVRAHLAARDFKNLGEQGTIDLDAVATILASRA
ncbi:iron-containing alcohol dehydrogenase [Endothiovibrio diazotrophicus]